MVAEQACEDQLVKMIIQHEERVAITSELNPPPGWVTGHREVRGKGYRAATQVKVLNPEIAIMPVAEAFILAAGSTLITVMRGNARLAGSESAARYQMVNPGTLETHGVLPPEYARPSPHEGKVVPTASWESDQLVVVMKQGNACGAKGLAGEPGSRDTSSGHGTGQRKSTKLNSMTRSTEGEEVHLKSRMREICTSGPVRGLVVDAVRRRSPALLDRYPCSPYFPRISTMEIRKHLSAELESVEPEKSSRRCARP